MMVPETAGAPVTEWLAPGPCLGEGGFGVVYEAYDRRRKARVALKTLRRFDAAALLRFKREFRTMADLAHRNLVTLYDLVYDGERCFFTMELVEGQNLIDHVREQGGAVPPEMDAGARGVVRHPAAALGGGLPRIDRLRAAFAQLAEGVCTLHEAGMLHRDLKPLNVLVEGNGRVVLLDFGLATPLTAGALEQSSGIVGTPQYMAPEQMAGSRASEASDWYSVGVMLYEAATGQRPFGGTYAEMLARKRRLPSPMPSDALRGVPADIDALCRELLCPDPRARPTGRDVLRRLRTVGGMVVAAPVVAPVTLPAARRPPFVGRERDFETLRKAFLSTKRGRSVTVSLRGRSGMGKTALARRFLADLRQQEPDVVLLAGRCYEQESVPYKALDSLVDSLCQYLKRLPAIEAARLMPRDVLDLARLFPVLREVEAVATARQRIVEIASAQEQRRRAATALRDLLARIADQNPLVIFIDDLQWGDADSGVLLNEILRPPDAPALMLIVCYRSEDARRSTLLRTLWDARAAWSTSGDMVDLEIGELSPGDARTLALALLTEHPPNAVVLAEAITRESAGHPFFLVELAQYVATGDAAETGETSLEEMIHTRVAALPTHTRRLLEVVAVAGQPLSFRAAHTAAGLDAEEDPTVGLLRAARLVRTRRVGDRSEIVTYHDRIREAVTARLPVETLRSHHEQLARSLEELEDADAETLAVHSQAAGYPERAAVYTVRAAEEASKALAFERSARLYALALDLTPREPTEARALRGRLADALANAGRGPAAGEAYLAGAEGASADEGLELRRQAAQQFLISGHIEEGLAVLNSVLHSLGMRLAPTPRRALLSLLARRLQLALRGLRFRERPAADLSRDEIVRIDSGWVAARGLGMVDPLRAAEFQVRHLLTALRAGEPYRIARALALEVGYSTVRGRRSRRRAERLGRLAQHLAERVGNPHALGLAVMQQAAAANLYGHFRKAHELCERAEPLLRDRCTGVVWELDTVHLFRLHSLAWMGAWRDLADRTTVLLKEAQDRGDLYLTVYLRARIRYLLRLAADDPETAAAEQRTSLKGWSQQGFLVQHYWDWFARGEIDLYTGTPRAAWERIWERWPDYLRSRLHYYEALYIETLYLRGRVALALAATPDGTVCAAETKRLLAQAARDARGIERERAHWGEPLAQLLRAGLAAARGDRPSALALASSAEQALHAADMEHYAAAARRRRGALLGGDEGRTLVESADAWMWGQGIRNPARMTAMLVPGAWERMA